MLGPVLMAHLPVAVDRATRFDLQSSRLFRLTSGAAITLRVSIHVPGRQFLDDVHTYTTVALLNPVMIAVVGSDISFQPPPQVAVAAVDLVPGNPGEGDS